MKEEAEATKLQVVDVTSHWPRCSHAKLEGGLGALALTWVTVSPSHAWETVEMEGQ